MFHRQKNCGDTKNISENTLIEGASNSSIMETEKWCLTCTLRASDLSYLEARLSSRNCTDVPFNWGMFKLNLFSRSRVDFHQHRFSKLVRLVAGENLASDSTHLLYMCSKSIPSTEQPEKSMDAYDDAFIHIEIQHFLLSLSLISDKQSHFPSENCVPKTDN